MELIKRLPFSGYSQTTTISWRWIFSLCCSFSASNSVSDHKELEERRLISLRSNVESQYQTINLEEAAEWITETVQPLSSIPVTEVDDQTLDTSESDSGQHKFDQEDAKTIAAEEFGNAGKASKDDEARSDASDEGIQKFATVIVSFKFEMMRSLLSITFHGVDNLPSKTVGGASAYQLAAVIFDESDKKLYRWNSTQFTYNTFKTEQVMEYPEMSAKAISSTAVRIRLYGCERKRRDILLSEIIVGLGNVDLKKAGQYKLKMEKRGELKHFDKKNSECTVTTKSEKLVKTVKITPIKSFFTSKSENSSIVSSSESNSSHIFVTRTNPVKKNPFIRMADDENNFSKEMSKKANIQVEAIIGVEAELLVGLAYNPITGRLTIEIVKGNAFKNPLSRGDEKPPNSFVKVTLCSGNNQEITRSKTEVRRNQTNPLFKEKFMFQVPQFQLAEVTLMFGVYHRKSAHRKEIIGWFSIGFNNSSSEELIHWKNMLQSNGEEVFQWHELLQNTKSRQGLPGAD